MQITSHTRTIADDLAAMRLITDMPIATHFELQANLEAVYRALFAADLQRYDVVGQRKMAAATLQGLFEFRLGLRDQIANWAKRGFMTHEVQKALRDVFRVTRYAADMVGELNIAHDRLPPGAKTRRAFTGNDANVLVNPAFQTGDDLAFQSGDVILVRGQAHNSAAIARIGDIDSLFSHVGLVYVDPQGKPFKVEALIETGAVVTPLEVALDHNLGRAVLLRHRDPAVAARAAKAIYDHVIKRRLRRIWYDFTMTVEGYKYLYCSKLVRLAYLMGSNGDVLLPAYSTRLDMKNRDFLDRVGVKTIETFAPGDLEIDPRFDIVAEWQDYRVTANLRNQDMIATKLFEFMEDHNYRFEEDLTIKLIGLLGRLSGFLSEDAKDMMASILYRVPPNMKRRTIAVIAMLHKTAEPLLEELVAMERGVIARTGHVPHPRDVLAHLDEVFARSGGRIGYLVGPPG